MPDDALIRRLDAMATEFGELEQQLSDPAVLSQPQRAGELARRRAAMEPLVALYRDWQRTTTDAANLRALAETEPDPELRALAAEELPAVDARTASLLEQIKGELVTSEDRAVGSVMLEIRAGVGGDEAMLFAGDLVEIYQRYAGEKGWSWELLEFSGGEVGGVRHAVAHVTGPGVWQHLGYEGGTHCVKRVPATETQGRIHTSTATVAVLPEPTDVQVQIPPEDVKIDVTTARGPGGQNVNKVATAVKMVHIPTGIEVRMQETKSQQQNRQRAWALLRARVYEHARRHAAAQRHEARSKMIGSGDRSERIRTYRWKENIVVDHRLDASFNLSEITAGHLDKLISALIEQDKQQRLAAL